MRYESAGFRHQHICDKPAQQTAARQCVLYTVRRYVTTLLQATVDVATSMWPPCLVKLGTCDLAGGQNGPELSQSVINIGVLR